MSISLTPEQISDLARQINEAISGLTNIEAILEATRADLQRARDLERRANSAKSDFTVSFVLRFLVRDSMLSALYAIARPSVRPSVCHTGGSVKNG